MHFKPVMASLILKRGRPKEIRRFADEIGESRISLERPRDVASLGLSQVRALFFFYFPNCFAATSATS